MKKKILFVVQLPPPVHGASTMNRYAYESETIRSAFTCSALPLQFAGSVTDIGSFRFKKLWLMLLFCFRLVAKLVRFRPHVVYFTLAPVGSAFYRDALFSLLIKLFRTDVLFHLHGKGIGAEATSSKWKKALYRLTFRNSRVIVLAESLKEDIRDVYTGTPFVLHNGIPEWNCPVRKKEEAPVTFLYLSNLVRSKGIVICLDSIKLLRDRNIPFRLRVVGAPYDISLEDVRNFAAENNLAQEIEVLGPLYGTEKQEVLCTSDVLVFPTYYPNEAFPLTILEAMQAGLPVIATDNGAIREIITEGETGFITPVRDALRVAEKMAFLAANPAVIQTMGQKAKHRYEQAFTIQTFEQGLFNIFKQVFN